MKYDTSTTLNITYFLWFQLSQPQPTAQPPTDLTQLPGLLGEALLEGRRSRMCMYRMMPTVSSS